MPLADLGDVQLNYTLHGPAKAPPVVLVHALGTDQRIWDRVIPTLPDGLRILTFDLRGHGGSSVPEGPYSMGALVRDAERLMEFCEIRDSLFVGLSIGGMIAQGLAVKRLDLIRALVLSNTAAKIGTPEIWQRRMAAIRADGLAAIGAETMQRWFPRAYLKSGAHAPTEAIVEGTSVEGYLGCCAAVAGTDFYTPTSGLRLPTLGIAGSEDGSTPPDLVRETIDLIPGAQFALMRRSGHVPPIDQPEAYGARLTQFLQEVGHIG
ncbi:3-oxoadipate enol-lactonase [Tritonibacter scottomollicae]|uniref:3-oxoadipate enol-lactonase n=1 Tax=Tritonibacter scottomollicae TaxID=483013 RepID=A0ABZ0HAW2_TRISK|nr:3-oxoadipate enol-lactonase [Tritonibacter scottomollicae]WOI31739.1 3-oxoadipate enol-lactonase [Tritonibacter scottomollicae]